MAIVEHLEGGGPRRRLQLKSPVTLESIGEIECATAEDICAVVQRAREAQSEWAELSFEDRAQPMWRLLRLVVLGLFHPAL